MSISKYTHLRPDSKIIHTFLHVFIRVISIFRQATGTSFMISSIKITCFFSQNFKVMTTLLWIFYFLCLRSSFDILQRSISQNCKKIILNTGIYGYHRFKEKFEDTKGVIRSRKSKDRQHNDQKKKNNLQYITKKTKDWATRTPLKTRDKLRCSGRVSSSCSISGTHRITRVLLKLSFHNQILCCFRCLC